MNSTVLVPNCLTTKSGKRLFLAGHNTIPLREAAERIIEFSPEDASRSGLLETPTRFAKAWSHLLDGYSVLDPRSVLKCFDDVATMGDQLVVLRNIEFHSVCEHHMLPFFGHAHIAYLPKKNGKIVGISKLARLLDIYAHRLQVQERICKQVVTDIQAVLKPHGAICVLRAQHLCITQRGVEKQDAEMVTIAQTGCFSNPTVKNEFMSLIRV